MSKQMSERASEQCDGLLEQLVYHLSFEWFLFNALGAMWFCDIKPFQFSWVPSLLILSIVIIRERLGRRISFQYSFLYIYYHLTMHHIPDAPTPALHFTRRLTHTIQVIPTFLLL